MGRGGEPKAPQKRTLDILWWCVRWCLREREVYRATEELGVRLEVVVQLARRNTQSDRGVGRRVFVPSYTLPGCLCCGMSRWSPGGKGT
jgi:hypothetical protein